MQTNAMPKTPLTKTRRRFIASCITLGVVLLVYSILLLLIRGGVINAYYVGIINLACINVVAAVGLNIVTGFLGQLVLGHAGFMMIGAYTSAILSKTFGIPLAIFLPMGMLLGGIAAAAIGFLIGIPALRLRGDYLAIITLGFGEIIRVVANNLEITNTGKNYTGFPVFNARQEPAALFTFVFFTAAFVIFFSYTFGTSRHGRAVISIREDEIAAESCGVNTTYYKLMAFTLSAFFGGVAGALLAHNNGVLQPVSFGFSRSVEYLMMVVLGGMGSITGSVISAVVLTVLPETLRAFRDYRMLAYSVLLVGVMLFRPTGLFGRREISIIAPFDKLRAKLFPKKAQAPKEGK